MAGCRSVAGTLGEAVAPVRRDCVTTSDRLGATMTSAGRKTADVATGAGPGARCASEAARVASRRSAGLVIETARSGALAIAGSISASSVGGAGRAGGAVPDADAPAGPTVVARSGGRAWSAGRNSLTGRFSCRVGDLDTDVGNVAAAAVARNFGSVAMTGRSEVPAAKTAASRRGEPKRKARAALSPPMPPGASTPVRGADAVSVVADAGMAATGTASRADGISRVGSGPGPRGEARCGRIERAGSPAYSSPAIRSISSSRPALLACGNAATRWTMAGAGRIGAGSGLSGRGAAIGGSRCRAVEGAVSPAAADFRGATFSGLGAPVGAADAAIST